MAEQKIELRKIRDFGQNINDCFVFLRQNLKPLLKSFFAICGVFMLGQAIFNGIYQSNAMGGLFQQLISGTTRTGRYGDGGLASIFSATYFLMLLFTLLTYVSMNLVLGAYLKYYLEHDREQPGIEDIWLSFRRYFSRVFFYSIPIAALTFIGAIFCLAPGIYLWVVFVPFTMVVIIEDADFGTAFSRCFEIVKENWWISFAIYLVAYIIYSVSSSIIGIIVGLFAGAAAYFTTKDVGTTVGIVTSFLNTFSFLFYIIFFICAALQYFTLAEQKDGTGILSRIDSIGSNNNNFDQADEQY
jgi:hypothetical protein